MTFKITTASLKPKNDNGTNQNFIHPSPRGETKKYSMEDVEDYSQDYYFEEQQENYLEYLEALLEEEEGNDCHTRTPLPPTSLQPDDQQSHHDAPSLSHNIIN